MINNHLKPIDITYMSLYDEKFYDLLNSISKLNDNLKNNYLNLKKNFFNCLTIIVNKNDDIVAFSGLQTNEERWGKYIGRIFSRMFIHPDYRYTNKYILGNYPSYTELMFPIQIECAIKHNLDSVFFSREHGRNSTITLTKKIESRLKNVSFYVPAHRYNLCGNINPVPESCKQYVSIFNLTRLGKKRWKNMEKYITYE